MRRVAAALPAIFRDLFSIVGAGLVSYGAWLVFPPAGYIALGVIVLSATILSARHS